MSRESFEQARNIEDVLDGHEASAERWADENVIGDNFICDCGQQCKLSEGVALSPNPYCTPVCPDCAMKDPAYAKWCSQQHFEQRRED